MTSSGVMALLRSIFGYIGGLIAGPFVIFAIAAAIYAFMWFILCWMLLNDAWSEWRGK